MGRKVTAVKRGQKLARECRAEWDLGHDLIKDLFLLFEEHGIDVIRWPMDQQLSGCAARLPGIGPALFINTEGETLGRQNFTAAHELFHLRDETSRETIRWEWKGNGNNGKPLDETAADIFAAELLLPGPGLSALMSEMGIVPRKITPEELIRLELHLEVSHQFLVYRLHNSEHITAKKRDELLKIQPVKLALEMGYDDSEIYGEEEPVFPRRLRALAFKALEQGIISARKFQSLLKIDDRRFRRYVEEMNLDITADPEEEMML